MTGIIFAIAIFFVFEICVIIESKKSHYRAWKQEFERELGEQVDDIATKDLYDQSMPVKTAVEIYKELKETCEKKTY